MMKTKFHLRLIPTLVTIVLVPVLCALGFWQLDRAKQKTEMQNLYLERFELPTEQIGAKIENPQELEYRSLRATGSWDSEHEFLLDNQILNGRPGYHVITPLIFRGGQSAVLINRGWIVASPDRTILPEIELLNGDAVVTGHAVIPPVNPFQLKKSPPLQGNWEIVWQSINLKRFEEAVPYELQQVVILMSSDHTDGFERQWNPPDNQWIMRHKAYAFQWFALCGTLLVIYFVLAIWRPLRAVPRP